MKYIRTTHIDNVPKFFSPEAKKAWQSSTCNGHLLYPDRPLTLDEVVEEHRRYDKQFAEDADNYTPQQIKEGLDMLVKVGMVAEVEN